MWNVVQSSQLGARSQVLVVRCTGLRYQLCCCLLGKGGFFSAQAAASTVRWMMPGEGRSRQAGTFDGWCRYLRSSVANVSGSSSVSEVRWPVEVDHQRGRCPANCGENQLAPGKRYLPLSCCLPEVMLFSTAPASFLLAPPSASSPPVRLRFLGPERPPAANDAPLAPDTASAACILRAYADPLPQSTG